MSIGDRIKQIRTEKHLTQAQFADKIGLRATAIGMYESGDRNVTDRSIISICSYFDVSEEWLRTGEGEMFKASANGAFSQFVNENGLDGVEESILRAYVKLPDEYRRAAREIIRRIADECIKADMDAKRKNDIDTVDEIIGEMFEPAESEQDK